ncbi:hypothetical protein Goarm_013853 [Gossypium armourianum]|uniref:Uncharacterized protein n=1 Tax=Gossypium armourianum TaxID=34283 RepID=A0A7J9J709_9ROSI|nr:hypothetical protein [Gossypium armourianum]
MEGSKRLKCPCLNLPKPLISCSKAAWHCNTTTRCRNPDWAIKSYYGISRNLLIKFKDDSIDETPKLAKVLSSESAISSMLDMSIRSLPGDHGLPLQQALPDVPPAMADAVNRGGELLVNLSAGTPWETVAKEVSNTLGVESSIIRAEISKDMNNLVEVITSWMASNSGTKLFRP